LKINRIIYIGIQLILLLMWKPFTGNCWFTQYQLSALVLRIMGYNHQLPKGLTYLLTSYISKVQLLIQGKKTRRSRCSWDSK